MLAGMGPLNLQQQQQQQWHDGVLSVVHSGTHYTPGHVQLHHISLNQLTAACA
jgi:hypothetical protein